MHGKAFLMQLKAQWNAMERNGTQWNAMERNGTQWNAMEIGAHAGHHGYRARGIGNAGYVLSGRGVQQEGSYG
jgi:hypothetical protein